MQYFWFVAWLVAGTVGFLAVHGYVWWRLCRDTTAPGSRWRPLGAVLLGVLAAFGVGARFAVPSSLPLEVQAVVGWPGWLWFGVLVYVVGLLMLAEPLRWWLLRRGRAADRLALSAAADAPAARPADAPASQHADVAALVGTGGSRDGTAPADPPDWPADRQPDSSPESAGVTRRVALARAVGVGVAATTAATVGYGLYEGHRTPRVRQVTVPLARLDRRFDGYRIAVVGDTHLSALRGADFCRRVVAQINGTQPDLIAFVGDLANGEADQLRAASAPLADLRARDGAYFVAGNAEHYVGADQWLDRVAELGMTPLPNTRVELPGFDVAGVNDLIVDERDFPGEVGPDLDAALAGRDPARPVLLLAHQPNLIDRAVAHGVDLQLSGHTHGGQMFPMHVATWLRDVQLRGLQRYDDTQLYVTNGAGTNGPPLRVGAQADITVVTLRAARA